uniref:Translocon-associated protein subunit alpha n=1 Tax=Wollemia nobilis TaxID=56998 RepID=A0A0C9RPM0_9CONI
MAILRFSAILLVFGLLFASPFLQVVNCQEVSAGGIDSGEEGELGIVGDGVQDSVDSVLGPASGVDTTCFFPKNSDKLIPAGGETEILVGVNNEGESSLKVHSIKASLHLPYYHGLLVQNLTVQEFVNATVPHSAQATFPYSFTVNKYLQPGEFTLVGSMFYEVDEQLYQAVFYNGTVEVVEGSGILSGETVFLITLGMALLGLFGLWLYGQIQRISKKTKRTKKVEVGTRNADTTNEWLQGTAFTQGLSKSLSQSQKSKKKK